MSNSGATMDGLVKVDRDLSKEEIDTIDEFHRTVFKILKICRKVEPNNIEIEWLQSKLSLARDVDPLLIMNRSMDKIWIYRKEILERNEEFFLKNKFDKFIKNDENKTFMYTLVNLIKKKYRERSEEEKNLLWELINQLLVSVVQYKKISGDYKQ